MPDSSLASPIPSFWSLRRGEERPRIRDEVIVPYGATLEQLKACAASPGSGRWAAFVALGYSSDPSAFWTLVCATFSIEWRVRRAACEALTLRARTTPVISRISEMLDDPVPSVVRTACSALAALDARGCRGRMLALLHDPDAATRHVAVAALDRLWDPGDSQVFLELSRSDPSNEVSKGAAAVLMRRARLSSWKPLFDAWIGHPSARYRIDACRLSERFGDASIVPRLSELRADPDERVRGAAESALNGMSRGTPGIRPRGRSVSFKRADGYLRSVFGVAARTRDR
jgi:HEAT repeat protein